MVEEKKEAPVMVITSRVKDYIKEKGLRSEGDLGTVVNELVAAALDKAVQRCKDNDRKTVRPADL